MAVRNNGFCGCRRHRRFCFRHTPPMSFPTPCPSPGGGLGDRHLVNPHFFVAAHCVFVWHCRLYPLYSWQDILLIFAEMELDSTTAPSAPRGNLFWRGSLDIQSTVMHLRARWQDVMLNSFVLCCNFCACKCACTVVVRFPRGGGGPSLGDHPPGGGGGPSSLGGNFFV